MSSPSRRSTARSAPINLGGAPRPSQTMANWALGLSLVPCAGLFVAGGAVAVVGLVQGAAGRAKLVAAVVVSSLWLVAVGTALVLFARDGEFHELLEDPDDDPVPTDVDRGRDQVLTEDLRPGDCLVSSAETSDTRVVTVVPCFQSHRSEVYAEVALDAGGWPGAGQTAAIAEARCADLLPASAASLTAFVIAPTDEVAFATDPNASCLVDLGRKTAGRVVPVP